MRKSGFLGLLAGLFLVFCTGCATVQMETPDGWTAKYATLLQNKQITGFQFAKGADGQVVVKFDKVDSKAELVKELLRLLNE